jgi:glycosyltransferase 2 family protein
MSSGRQRLVVALGLLVSAVALFFVVRSIDVAEAFDVLAAANPLPLLAVLGVVAVQVSLRAFRWSVLLPRLENGSRIPFLRLVPPLLVGYLGNAVLPARLGEPMRAVLAARRENVGMPESLGSVLVERVVDTATLAPVAFGAALVVGAPAWVVQLLGVTAVIGAVVLAVLLTVGVMPLVRLANRVVPAARTGVRDVIERFGASLGGPSRRPQLLTAAGISTLAWFLDAASVWLVASSIGVEIDYAAAMLISGVGTLGTAIPSAPGYVGTYELAVAGIAGLVGVDPAPALALAVLVHVMTLGPVAIGGAVSVVAIGADLGEVARAAEASGRE